MASPILQCARWAGVRVWALAGVVPEGLGVTRTGYRAPIPMENSGKWAGALQSQVQTYLFFLLQCGRGHVFTSIRQGFFISIVGVLMESTSQAFCDYCDAVDKILSKRSWWTGYWGHAPSQRPANLGSTPGPATSQPVTLEVKLLNIPMLQFSHL